MHLANEIEHVGSVVGIEEAGITGAKSGNIKLAELMTLPAASPNDIWLGALFAQVELLRISWHLARGRLSMLGTTEQTPIPLCPLHDLGPLGPDRKRIHEGFKVTKSDWTPFPGFWGHKSDEVVTIAQTPNCKLLEWKDSPRGPHYGSHLWLRAGNILLAERLRTNTQRIIAALFPEKVLGNTWWALNTQQLDVPMQKALVLWLNSSLCVLAFFSRRVTTEGAFVQMKQPAWESMLVLDVRNLTKEQLTALANAYDEVASKSLAPLAQLDADPVRISIDEALCAVLGLPSLAPVRALLAREPGLTGRKIGP